VEVTHPQFEVLKLHSLTTKLNGIERNSLSGEFRPARKAERLSNCLEDRSGEIAVAVKMRPTHTWTRRPRGALLELGPVLLN